MAKDRKGSPAQTNGKEEEPEEGELSEEAPSKRDHGRKSKRKNESETEEDDRSSEDERKRKKKKKKKKKMVSKRRSRRRYSDEDSYSSSSYSSDSESDGSDYTSEESENEDERHRRKRKERKRRKEREYEKEKRRIRREKEKEKERKRKKRDKEGKDKKKKKKKEGTKGAVTDSWGKYGIIRETDMWNKRPEFSAWLAEVKQVNLEALSNWEEKQMFKEFMEDHNTATFPSKKYYSLDAYHKRKMEKEMKKGFKRGPETERTIFNDEEQRRKELQLAREKMKEEQVEALKHSMQSGLAQAMKEQAQLREEMAYQYKLGNFEAAAAIQRRLDPDVAM